MPARDADGRDEDEGDGYEDDYESDGEGHVHPLPAPVDPAKSFETDHLVKHKLVPPPVDLESSSAQSEAPLEDSADEQASVTLHKEFTTFPDEIIRLHASRSRAREDEQRIQPPPAPGSVSANEAAVISSVLAQKRVNEYKRSQMLKEEQLKEERARELQARKEVRRMYKSFNQSIGVADVPPTKRYEEAVRAKRQEKKVREERVAAETANRWYRRIQRQSRSICSAGDYGAKVLEEARKTHQAKLKLREEHRRAVEKKLKQLSLEAKKIIADNVGAYERGSFILKSSSKHPPTQESRISNEQ